MMQNTTDKFKNAMVSNFKKDMCEGIRNEMDAALKESCLEVTRDEGGDYPLLTIHTQTLEDFHLLRTVMNLLGDMVQQAVLEARMPVEIVVIECDEDLLYWGDCDDRFFIINENIIDRVKQTFLKDTLLPIL